MLKKLFNFFLNIIFPPICLACKKYLNADFEKAIYLCEQCFSQIEINNSFFCPECNRRLPVSTVIINGQLSLLNVCHPNSKFILAAVTSYQNVIVREIIHSLKYSRVTSAIKPIGKIIEMYLNKILVNNHIQLSSSIIIPIPLHHQKFRKRGFNQAELIAKKLQVKLTTSQVVNVNLNNIKHSTPNIELNNLVRIKNTASQTKLKKEERQKNIENCFILQNPEKIAGKNIILVDDVFTSGSTIKEAVYVLKNAGARKVLAFVIAKT